MPTTENFVLAIFGVAWVCGVCMCRKFYSAREWPSVDGVITKSELASKSPGADSSGSYVMDVEYEYIVHGRKYVKNGLRLGWKLMMSWRAAMEKRLAEYPVGREVRVSYNPRRPQESFVVATDPEMLRAILVVMAGVLLAFWIVYN